MFVCAFSLSPIDEAKNINCLFAIISRSNRVCVNYLAAKYVVIMTFNIYNHFNLLHIYIYIFVLKLHTKKNSYLLLKLYKIYLLLFIF